MTATRDRLREFLAAVLRQPAATISDELMMKDVEVWDSLKHMELVLAIEEEFGLQLSADEIVGMRSVAEIERVLRARGVLG